MLRLDTSGGTISARTSALSSISSRRRIRHFRLAARQSQLSSATSLSIWPAIAARQRAQSGERGPTRSPRLCRRLKKTSRSAVPRLQHGRGQSRADFEKQICVVVSPPYELKSTRTAARGIRLSMLAAARSCAALVPDTQPSQLGSFGKCSLIM
jgi:hypothetical protein